VEFMEYKKVFTKFWERSQRQKKALNTYVQGPAIKPDDY